MDRPDAIGPWLPGIDPAERLARLRSLRALVGVFAPGHLLVMALARAEVDPSDEVAQAAWDALMTVPSLKRRRILASMGTLLRTSIPKERKHG
jgi:hypothetical protein